MKKSNTTAEARARMVEEQLVTRDITDTRVLEAMREVPRHEFVSADIAAQAYSDVPLFIGEGQTISQPYIVALMAQLLGLERSARVLEIGTGSGYSASVLAKLACEVFTVERHAALAERAERTLVSLGMTNVHVRIGDGSVGWPEQAPFDAIAVTAAGPGVPKVLLAQLASPGRLVMPVGPSLELQELLLIEKKANGTLVHSTHGFVRFVPLMGKHGWAGEPDSSL